MDIPSTKQDLDLQFALCERLQIDSTQRRFRGPGIWCAGQKKVIRVLREKIFFQNKRAISQTLSCFFVLSVTSSNNSEIHSMNKMQDWAQYLHYKLHPLKDLEALYKYQLIKPDSPPK